MDERQFTELVETLTALTAAVTELAVKVKRLTNTNPITPEMYNRIITMSRDNAE